MTNDQVFAEIARRGADRAVVHFSGGNDEGGADDVTLFKGEEKVAELQEWHFPERGDGKPAHGEKSNDDLVHALVAPVYAQYGSFAGEFSVYGTVTWDTATKTAKMSKEEQSGYDHSEEYV